MKNKTTANRPQPSYIRRGHQQSKSRKKIGFDLHGVVETNADFFRILMRDLIRHGWQVHIITGGPWKYMEAELKKLNVPFTHFFSILDHHSAIGTRVVWKGKRGYIDPHLWNETKAIYCKVHNIKMHFDDSDIYGLFFQTPYVRYFSKDSDRVQKMHIVPAKVPAAKKSKKRH